MLKVAAVLQHAFSKMEPDTHYYDVIRLQISHALHTTTTTTSMSDVAAMSWFFSFFSLVFFYLFFAFCF